LLGLLFNPEDGSNIFHQNMGWLLLDYEALDHKRQKSLHTTWWYQYGPNSHGLEINNYCYTHQFTVM
jgi:hypothetical protein